MVKVSGVPYEVELDLPNVSFVWATEGMEGYIAAMARVSNPENQDNPDYERLIRYLIKHQHWSPFEMVNVCMEINCTRDIARQILRHRSFTFQEFSQRYAEAQQWDISEARMQDNKNRQNSLETADKDTQRWWQEEQQKVLKQAKTAYSNALKLGIAKEVARKVLPEGLTMSKMYMNGTLRSWVHYVTLRSGNGTQKEHRLIAEQCKTILTDLCPTVMNAL